MPLSAAEAEKRLLTFRVPKARKGKPKAFLEATLNIKHLSPYSEEYLGKVGSKVAALNFLTRKPAMAAIAGPLRPTLENALRVAASLPYQTHGARVPFRARNVKGVGEINMGRVVQYCVNLREHYDQPIEWFAEWCGYLETELAWGFGLDVLLAAEIDAGNKVVLDILLRSTEGTHPLGVISATGIRGLLRCNNPAAWQAIEGVLLGAGRAEGLRQTIIECVDELNPLAFERFVRVAIEHNLLRFSSVFRAFVHWFPGLIQDGKVASAEKVLMRMLEFLRDQNLHPRPEFDDTYLRLWADAYLDAEIALRRGKFLLGSKEVHVRRAVASIASEIGLTAAGPLIEQILEDEDRRVCVFGLKHIQGMENGPYPRRFYSNVRALAKAWPEKASDEVSLSRKDVWELAFRLSPQEDTPFFFMDRHELSADARFHLASRLRQVKDLTSRKAMVLKLAADNSSSVRVEAFSALSSLKIEPQDAPELEILLTRKASDLRMAVITALARLPDGHALASARRLIASGDASQRHGGEELAAQLVKRGVREAAELAPEQTTTGDPSEVNPRNLFGLLNLADLTYAPKPGRISGVSLYTQGAIEILKAVDDYLHSRKDEVTAALINGWEDGKLPIGNLTYVNLRARTWVPEDVQIKEKLPLVEEFESWIGPQLPSADTGWEDILRARIISEFMPEHSNKVPPEVARQFSDRLGSQPRYLSATRALLEHLTKGKCLPAGILLDLLANEISERADKHFELVTQFYTESESSWRTLPSITVLRSSLLQLATQSPDGFKQDDWKRAFLLLRYIDEPGGREERAKVEQIEEEMRLARLRSRPYYEDAVNRRRRVTYARRDPVPMTFVDRAFQVGACTRSDVLDQVNLVLSHATQSANSLPATRAVLQKLVDRIVEVETKRGDLQGAASKYANEVSGMIHLPHVLTILKTGVPLARTPSFYYGDGLSRAQSFTRLLSYSRPTPDESVEQCATAFRELKVKPERLIELAMLSPHWSKCIERVLGWDGLEDAVWWLHAHTKDQGWGIPVELKALWAGAISERTPLTANQLENGCCDPGWFHRFRNKLDDKQWKLLEKNAKFASHGTGHARAQIFAKALSGELTSDHLVATITAKRNPNHVRALGLVQLGVDREDDLVSRYQFLQEFLAGSRQFGSLRQQTEKLAFEVAVENLAATAGFPDALRLTWAMEASEVQDLAAGGLTIVEGELSVRLFFDGLGQPTVEASKNGKPIKEVPAAAKKNGEIKSLFERRTRLKKQLSRMRLALEQAMQRGDNFTAEELRNLMLHPGLKPLLQNLVFVGESGIADFPSESGSVGDEPQSLRIAHPFDLLQSGLWPEIQTRVFREERVQPFKQVFRELYILTDAEKSQTELTRYGGHQVRPTQAIAILGKRGWIARHEEGISKTYHKQDITAHINMDYVGYSPADVEGTTLHGLEFTRSSEWKPIPLSEVPPLLFSETVRDLDLIVSVASMVGVDPEASESTVEMRQRVVEQTAQLLHLENISFIPRHIVISGELAQYTVHLGSGTVHQRAKGELVIIAVRQPQRGRLFLPFVDDDPRTAEIVSKAILLSRDSDIKDPTILRQIVGA